MYPLDHIGRRVLSFISKNPKATPAEISQEFGIDVSYARRIQNHLFSENYCFEVLIPNYAMLGYEIMAVQQFRIKPTAIKSIPKIKERFTAEYPACIDCHETFDGKIQIRTAWKNPAHFSENKQAFFAKYGIDWFLEEETNIIPLDKSNCVMNVRSIKVD